jgi:hypothetical protein
MVTTVDGNGSANYDKIRQSRRIVENLVVLEARAAANNGFVPLSSYADAIERSRGTVEKWGITAKTGYGKNKIPITVITKAREEHQRIVQEYDRVAQAKEQLIGRWHRGQAG